MVSKLGRAILMSAVAALVAPVASEAAPVLRLTSGSTTVTVNDNGAGDADPRAQFISFIGSVGSFFTNVATSGSSNSPGALISAGKDRGILQLQSLQARNLDTAGQQTLDIAFSDNGFLPATGTNNLTSGIALTLLNATEGDTATFTSHVDPTNTKLVFHPTRTTGPQTAIANGLELQTFKSVNEQDVPAMTAVFSMTQHLVLNLSGGAEVNASGTTTAITNAAQLVIPEPGSLALAGIAGLGLLSRRRRA